MPNDPIRNYYPLFSIKQGSERVSNSPKATQQRNIRAIEEMELRIGLDVCRGGGGDLSLCLSMPKLDSGHSCWTFSSPSANAEFPVPRGLAPPQHGLTVFSPSFEELPFPGPEQWYGQG